MTHTRKQLRCLLWTAFLPVLALTILSAPTVKASAAVPAPLWKAGEGSGAGQVKNPRGVAADPGLPGHVFVADSGNSRIAEFDAWGQFVKAWGWGVRDGADEFQVCTGATGCRAGLPGDGAGQLKEGPSGIAIDSAGNVYAQDPRNYRVQKFNSAGEFLLMLGGEVNKTSGADVCTNADLSGGDECGAGIPGTAPSQFSPLDGLFWTSYLKAHLAVTPSGTVLVGDGPRIQEFNSDGSFKAEIPVPGELVDSLAVDFAGDIYLTHSLLSSGTGKPTVHKISPAGTPICTFKPQTPGYVEQKPSALAVDASGDVYVANGVYQSSPIEQFDSGCASRDIRFGGGELVNVWGLASGSGCLSSGINHYVAHSRTFFLEESFLRAYGPPPDDPACPPPARPPAIGAQFATSVDASSATVKTQVNPRFWRDTSYYVEFGTEKCSEGGCTQLANAPGVELGAGVVDAEVSTPGVLLSGLQADTEYHYRFVAQSGGGGPVRGQGGVVGSDGSEATFKTLPKPGPVADGCPNAAFRIGLGTRLADCRAYEMVSPVDKAGSDILVLQNFASLPARLRQSAKSGERITYSTYRAYGDAQAAPYMSQYLAVRGGEGWTNKSISPPREGPSFTGGSGLDSEFKAFSADLTQGWFLRDAAPVLAPGGVAGYSNLYRRDSGDGFTALSTAEINELDPFSYRIEMQGMSADGAHAIFTTNDNGPPAAKAKETAQLYEWVDGVVRPVCVLPNETVTKQYCSAGTRNSLIQDYSQNVANAISADGSRIFWSDSVSTTGPGRLYLRIDGAETIPVSDKANPKSPPKEAQFWTASTDGSTAIFTARPIPAAAPSLYEFDVDSETATEIAAGAVGVAGASDDASRVYFVSEDVIGPEAGPEAGQQNLYLYEAADPPRFTYIATLPDINDAGPSPINLIPRLRTSRVTADGAHLAFTSSSSLTGRESIDVNSGRANAQVYLYDAEADRLRCVSCNRTGARPVGRNLARELHLNKPFWAAGLIPGFENQLYSSRLLAEDGSRLFFESFEPLAYGDTNGKRDVYQWQEQGGDGCTPSSVTYSEIWGGCVSLVSSGESPQDSELIDASADSRDVFFSTTSSLVPQDPGLVDIYDARIGGGFPPPPAPPAQCEGEACQGSPTPLNDPTPASSNFRGPANPTSRKSKPKKAPRKASCAKGKKRGKPAKRAKAGSRTRCVKGQGKGASGKRGANSTGRGGR